MRHSLYAALAMAMLAQGCAGFAKAVPETGRVNASSDLDTLARDLDRVEAVRAVKNVQRSYAQLSQFGRWPEMATLFSRTGEVQWGDDVVSGPDGIAKWLAVKSRGIDGVRPGSLHTELIDQPLVNLSPDGRTAKARWMGIRFLGDGKGSASIEGGLYENDYVLENGTWKIAALRYHPQYQGDYASGWTNVGGRDLPIVPPHFTSDQSGVPIPAASGEAPRTSLSRTALAQRIARLNDEDAVRNVQNAYGYYVDRRMWDDVVDLFDDDSAVEIAGAGTFRGKAGVRQAMERMGPAGLKTGDLNERPIFDLIVEVMPGGTEAVARGIELGLLAGPAHPSGAWEFSVFRNRFVKQNGIWKLKELRATPLVQADYVTGWGGGGDLPRRPMTVPAYLGEQPKGLAIARSAPLTGAAAKTSVVTPGNVADLRRGLMRASAYDGVENVSSAYGFYIDDFQWPQMAAIFAEKGNKQSPFVGYYMGRDRILGVVNASWGPAPKLRSAISFHWRTQPVIHVSQDGRSANLRTRLFQPRTSKNPTKTPSTFYMGGLHGGMYPNDQAVLENGIWRLWSLTIDEHYFASPDWKGGWASARPREGGAPPPPSPLLTKYPPDVKIADLGAREEGFRGGTGETVEWPGILPMWFHYRNPVSGRVPDRFWPDCVPCEKVPEARMTAHGYQRPPTGPEIDGTDLAPRPSR